MIAFRKWTRWGALALALALALPIAGQATVTGRTEVTINFRDVRTIGAGAGLMELLQTFTNDFADGTGANQVNLCYGATRSLSSGANEDLDFAGALTNVFGTAVFAVIKVVAVQASSANTTNITVSRGATNGLVIFAAANDALAPLKPGGIFLFTDPSAAGLTVTASTGDLLNFANSAGATGSYTIAVCGES